MTPQDLADRHPRLYHVTAPDALPGILRHGLLPTEALLTLFEVPAAGRPAIERRRRPDSVRLTHPVHGAVTITDNAPLQERKLAACLEDELKPADWLAILNRRVFFWADVRQVQVLLQARLNRNRERLVLVLDTLRTLERNADRVELAAINTGATLYIPPRRGLATFTPLASHSYDAWRRLRGGRDSVREVTVLGGVRGVADLLIGRHRVGPGAPLPPEA